MTKKILAALPAIFLLAACGKKTPNCASPEATKLAQQQVAQQLIEAGVSGYSESEIIGMLAVSNIQTVAADSKVKSYKCKAVATINYPDGLAEKIATASSQKGALLYDIPKLLAKKYGLNAVGMSTQLAAIVMRSSMHGIEVQDTFTAALEKDNKTAVTYEIFKMEKAKDNKHYGVNGQLADTDFVNKTVFYMNIAPVIVSFSEQAAVEESAAAAKPVEEAAEAAPATEEAKPEAETAAQPQETQPEASQPEAKPAEEPVDKEKGKPVAEPAPEAAEKPAEEAKPAEEPKK